VRKMLTPAISWHLSWHHPSRVTHIPHSHMCSASTTAGHQPSAAISHHHPINTRATELNNHGISAPPAGTTTSSLWNLSTIASRAQQRPQNPQVSR
jgi:hypothetical protein